MVNKSLVLFLTMVVAFSLPFVAGAKELKEVELKIRGMT